MTAISIYQQLIEGLSKCNKCNLDLPIGRAIGIEDNSKVWAVGINPKLRDISDSESFDDIKKVTENGTVVHYLNKRTGEVIPLNQSFFDRLKFITANLFKSKSPVINEYKLHEDFYNIHNNKIDQLFSEAVPALNLKVGQGIALTDLVKCFSFDIKKFRKEDEKNTFKKIVYRNCSSFFLQEIKFKKPRLIFFTYCGAYDNFVEAVEKIEFGQLEDCAQIGDTRMTILHCEDFDCHLIRGTFSRYDFWDRRPEMIEQIRIAIKSMADIS